ncbi:MAG: helix-turn-helix domain-containing protein, partial [Acidimicrobiia bacterium]
GRARGGSPARIGPAGGSAEELAVTETVAYILEATSEALRQLRSAQQQAERLVRQAMELLASVADTSSPPATGPRRDPLLSLTEVAEVLGISRREVSQLVRDKVIPSVRLSGRILVPRAWVDDRGEEEMGGLGLA